MAKTKDTPTTNGRLEMIPINKIHENPVSLRKVDNKALPYKQLVDSIKQRGILNPISVREVKDEESGEVVYAVNDGLQRFTAAKDAGLKEVPAYVRNIYEAELLEAQIIGNAVRIETKPREYAEQLTRILASNPTLTVRELADRLNKSPAWLIKMLGLVRIEDPKLSSLVDEGKITLTNAQHLAKLPKEEQPAFADRAMTQSPGEFVPTVTGRLNEIKDAVRKGRKPTGVEEFVATPSVRKIKDIKAERGSNEFANELFRRMKVNSPIDAWNLALDYVLRIDPITLEQRKSEDEQRKKLKKEEQAKKSAEKAKIKAEEAARTAADLVTATHTV